tara:strand:- start:552 stop:875 length:324 start_codon:yes stop_codon:yes gene_type:complete
MNLPLQYKTSMYAAHIRINPKATHTALDPEWMMPFHSLEEAKEHFLKAFAGQALEIQKIETYKHKKYGRRRRSVCVFETPYAFEVRTSKKEHPDQYGFLRGLEGMRK